MLRLILGAARGVAEGQNRKPKQVEEGNGKEGGRIVMWCFGAEGFHRIFVRRQWIYTIMQF